MMLSITTVLIPETYMKCLWARSMQQNHGLRPALREFLIFWAQVHRFFADLNNIHCEIEKPEVLKGLHQTIQKVSSDIENLKFNTAISQLMIFKNLAVKIGKISMDTAKTFTQLLSPFAPHLAEELWSIYGNKTTITYVGWPTVNKEFLIEDSFEYPVSFNGKLRFNLNLPLTASKEEIEQAVLSNEKAQKWIEGKEISKIIIVPNKIVNIVVK